MKQDNITFEASFHAETNTAVAFLCIKGNEEGSWSTKEWFSKRHIWWDKIEGKKFRVSAPVWLLEKKGLIDKICLYD